MAVPAVRAFGSTFLARSFSFISLFTSARSTLLPYISVVYGLSLGFKSSRFIPGIPSRLGSVGVACANICWLRGLDIFSVTGF